MFWKKLGNTCRSRSLIQSYFHTHSPGLCNLEELLHTVTVDKLAYCRDEVLTWPMLNL